MHECAIFLTRIELIKDARQKSQAADALKKNLLQLAHCKYTSSSHNFTQWVSFAISSGGQTTTQFFSLRTLEDVSLCDFGVRMVTWSWKFQFKRVLSRAVASAVGTSSCASCVHFTFATRCCHFLSTSFVGLQTHSHTYTLVLCSISAAQLKCTRATDLVDVYDDKFTQIA